MMKYFFLILAISSLHSTATTGKKNEDPKPQRWADTWQMPFKESMKLGWDNVKSEVTGMFYYDYTKKRMRITRTSCRGDRFAGNTRLFDNSPCDHIIVSNGSRFLYWPQRKHCCYCCGPRFCSALKPEWIVVDSDFVRSEDGSDVFSARSDNVTIWQQQTGKKLAWKLRSSNYLDGVFRYDSNMTFTTDEYKEKIEDETVFDLPTDSGDCTAPCPQRFCNKNI